MKQCALVQPREFQIFKHQRAGNESRRQIGDRQNFADNMRAPVTSAQIEAR